MRIVERTFPETLINPFKHNVERWPDILLKTCSAKFFKVFSTFFNIKHERVEVQQENS